VPVLVVLPLKIIHINKQASHGTPVPPCPPDFNLQLLQEGHAGENAGEGVCLTEGLEAAGCFLQSLHSPLHSPDPPADFSSKKEKPDHDGDGLVWHLPSGPGETEGH
jgi:hypothetical protein